MLQKTRVGVDMQMKNVGTMGVRRRMLARRTRIRPPHGSLGGACFKGATQRPNRRIPACQLGTFACRLARAAVAASDGLPNRLGWRGDSGGRRNWVVG